MSEISKLQNKFIIKKIDKETLNIQILDNNILLLIVGEFNENLKQYLQKKLNGKNKIDKINNSTIITPTTPVSVNISR